MTWMESGWAGDKDLLSPEKTGEGRHGLANANDSPNQ